MAWTEVVTFAVAILGAALGIMNTWHTINVSRVRLRVRPSYATALPSGQQMFAIEVVNLSTFPVTVAEVGFSRGRGGIHRGMRSAVVRPLIPDDGPWPRRLGARESISVYFDPVEMAVTGSRIGKAYAKTACGEVEYGSSPALEQLREVL